MNGCPFCDYAGPSRVIADYAEAFVIEPLRPIVPGHVLVVARGHLQDAISNPRVFGDVARVAARYAGTSSYGACNLIASVGAAATQTVGHLHLHIVPRVEGDGLALPWTEAGL